MMSQILVIILVIIGLTMIDWWGSILFSKEEHEQQAYDHISDQGQNGLKHEYDKFLAT